MTAARSGDARARERIVAACRRCVSSVVRWRLDRGRRGERAIRLAGGRILITPAGASKAELRPRDLLIVDAGGRVVRGTGRPSTEMAMHLRIYRLRHDVDAVVHAHPPVATGFAVCGEAFAEPVLPEVILGLGPVTLAPYATPGTTTLADRMEPLLGGHDVFLLANHGATALGGTVEVAYSRMESLEHSARILLAARLLGRVRTLTDEQVRDLVAARDGAGYRGRPDVGTRQGDGLETE